MFIYLLPTLHTLLVLTFLTLWSSCTKKPVCPEPEPVNKTLAVALDKSYLGADVVDSAFAIWELNGQSTQFYLTNSHDTLSTDISKFQAGSGTLTLKIFSRLKFGVQYLSQWVSSQQATITTGKGLLITGPVSFSDLHWKPRVELKDAVGHFAVVALRPDDPYFFIKSVPGNLKSVIVARDYWRTGGGVNHIAGGEWECRSNCVNEKGHIENTQFFSSLPAKIGTNTWNHIEIAILYVEDQWGGGPGLSMTHSI